MNYDLTKVIAESVQIFVAIRAAEGTVTTNPTLTVVNAGGDTTWKKIGACKKKATKLTGTPFTTEIDDGLEAVHGGKALLACRNVEMSSAQMTLLEGFENHILDIILRVTDAAKAYKLIRCSLVKTTDMPFNQEESQGNDLKFTRDYPTWSAVVSEVTLT